MTNQATNATLLNTKLKNLYTIISRMSRQARYSLGLTPGSDLPANWVEILWYGFEGYLNVWQVEALQK